MLAANLREIRPARRTRVDGHRREPRQWRVAGQVRADLEKRARGMHRRVGNERRLGRARARQHERAPVVARREHHRERTAHRAELARQRELARELVAIECSGRDLAARREDAQRDRQVEAAALFRQVGRREVDGDLARREIEVRVLQRGAHAVARLADLGLGQPDDVDRRQPAAEVHLDVDRRRGETRERAAAYDGDRHGGLPSPARPARIRFATVPGTSPRRARPSGRCAGAGRRFRVPASLSARRAQPILS